MKISLQIGALFCLPFVALAGPVQTQSLQGHRPAAAVQLTPVGRLEAARELKLAIGLPLRDKEGLTNLLRRLYDPASPDYHHFLAPAQFANKFGPTEKDYQTVTAFAIANGLKVSATHPNRALLDVTGTVSNIEKAFHVTLRTYQHPLEKRVFYAPDLEPSLNLETPILHVSGLDNYLRPHPMFLREAPPAGFAGFVSRGGSGPSGTYMGDDFRAAYVPGLGLTGAGQSIGLLEFDGYYTNDIATYASIAGISAVPLTNVYLDGFDGTPGQNNTEVALDIDMANCMAPGLSSVIVYEGEVTDDILNRMATDGLANQLSASWSYPIDAGTEQIFQQFAAQGQSFFNASADDDAWVGEIASPCDNPNITIVGGTTLTTSGPGGAWVSETVWNWDVEYGPTFNGQGSSGGISTTYPIPTWQMGVSMAANQGSVTNRNVPDVALTADNIFVVAGNGQDFNVGGTSCATPLWAAFVALANEQSAAGGGPPIGFINPAIYALGLSPDYTNCFHDISTGNNTWSASPTLFSAVAGYDLCSGWGTPMGSTLINLLVPVDILQISPLSVWNSSGGVGGPLNPASQTYTLTNSGSTNFNWAVGASVPWLSLSPNGGTLTPGGTAVTLVASLNATANNLSLGTYFATIWFTNLSDGIAQSRSVSLEIITPPVITAHPASLAVIGGATANFTASAAGGLPLNCQWQYNGVNLNVGGRVSVSQTTTDDTNDIDGSVVSALTISNVAASDSGTYTLAASNAAGVAFSSDAVLTMASSAPVIIQQPASQTALFNTTVQFAVMANGTPPFTYQWQQNETNLTDGGAVSGSTTPFLTISAASSASIGTYTVVIGNAIGTTTSDGAVLMVQVAEPGQQLVQNGGFETGDFSFWDESGNFVNCSVSSSPLAAYGGGYGALLGPPGSLGFLSQSLPTMAGQSYLISFWLDSPNGDAPNEFQMGWNGSVMYDQTNLAAIGWTNLQFEVMATGTNTVLQFGFRDDQSFLGLDDIQAIPLADAGGPPIIATQPTSQVALQGAAATFSVLSAGETPLFYQWQLNGIDLADATNAMLELTNLADSQAGTYDVLIFNSFGSTTSSNALLTVLAGDSEMITFDDLPDDFTPVPAGYGGLIWSNFEYLNGLVSPPSGYNAGVVSVPNVAFNAFGTPASFSASTPFALLSAYLTAAWNNNLQVRVQGYNGTTLSYDNTYNLSAVNPTLITFNYAGVTSVQFIPSGGVPDHGYNGNGTQFAMDNVSVVADLVLPPPVTMPMAVLYYFNGPDGGNPTSALVQGADGNFYGTTEYGGASGYGTVFRMTTNGALATLLSFDSSNAYPYGSLVQGADGRFYGTTEYGGTNDNGTAFSVTTNGTLSTLASFDYDVTGGNPFAALLQGTNGIFYGTTAYGGSDNCGTVFSLTTNGALTTLVSFNYSNGANPQASLARGPDGKFYGTTEWGGAEAEQGSVYSITTNGILSTLASFNYEVGGLPCSGLVLGADGNFYGTTLIGGTNDDGTVFSMSTNGTISTLASFNYEVSGGYPTSALMQGSDGNFYGTTASGGTFATPYHDGTFGGGTVFRMTTNGTLTTLLSFENTNGLSPEAALVRGTDGYLYGTTYYGGAGYNGINYSGDGIVFRLGAAPTATPPAILAQPASQIVSIGGAAIFSVNASGAAPLNYCWQRNGSPIPGATQSSYVDNNVRSSDSGSQFSCVISNSDGLVTSGNAQLTVFNASGPLVSFNGADGGYSSAALLQGVDGNFYGTTAYGGTNGNGTVFRVTANGALSTLASFNFYVTGGNPWAGLAQGSDGNFYGTTTYGGAHDQGTVFRMTTNGALTALVSFNGTNGGSPYAGLVQGSDGNFYGTTFYGGIYNGGTVFRMTTNGALSILASFNGGYPYAGLAQGSDGNFYGTTTYGGSHKYGTVFRLDTNDVLTTLISFNNTNGAYPCAGLAQGADGNFYGTTANGGTDGFGTVFSLNANAALASVSSALTTLISFDNTNGANPYGALVQGADGNFYGTTTAGGTNGDGTVFSITTSGQFAQLFSFGNTDGSSAYAALIQSTNGSFYCTTSFGGAGYDGLPSSGNGTVFRLAGAFTKEPPIIVTQPVSQTVVAGANVTFSVSVIGPGPFTYQWQFDGTNYLIPITSGVIATVAGNGTQDYFGDGGEATNASLSDSQGVAVDAYGNLFIADTGNQRIRMVRTDGTITTVAGNGMFGYSGDGGAGTNASLNEPSGVAVDAYGNVFVADTQNQRIRMIGTNGFISTVAGNGTFGYSGDGGAATNASLSEPSGVAVDAYGNLFIADTYNFRIREVGTNGIITTVAGNGIGGYFGDGEPATNASLNYPQGVALDMDGDLFIADSGNNCIREVDASGIMATVAGDGTNGYSGDDGAATNAELSDPAAIVVDAAGNIFIADSGNNRLRETDTNGFITTVAGDGAGGYSGDGGPAISAELNNPAAVAVGAAGNVFIADSGNNRLREVFLQTPTLLLTNVGISAAGSYDVVVSNAYGSITSSVVILTVGVPPAITSQPTNQTLMYGDTALFSVTASGTGPIFYQWQFNGVNLTDTPQIIGSQSNVLTLANATTDEEGTYQVVVTNAYGSTEAFAILEVQGGPVLTWTNPAPITYGSPLTASQLNATANVPGSFSYDPTIGAVLNAGANTLSVIFTPTNTVDDSSVAGSVSLVVLPAPLSVMASNAIRPYGQSNPVFTGAIIGVTNEDNITAAYSCSAQTNSPVGTYPIVPALVDPENRQTNYAITLVSGTLTITGPPILTWTNPCPITYGTPLGSNQLNATASVPGHFAYNPPSGSVLNAGSNLLSVIFTPSDTIDYSSATDTVPLVVLNVLVSDNILPTYEPFTEYAANIATNTAGAQTNSIDLCTAGLTAPGGEPWLCQSFSGTAGTGLYGLDIQVSNFTASVFTSNNLRWLLPTSFPGYPEFGNAITTLVINPAQPLVAVGTSPPTASANIVGNSAVCQFARDFTRPASGTKTLFVSYLFDDAQQGQTGNNNNGRYLCFVASNNIVEGRGSGGLLTNWQAMYNTFRTNAGPRYFSHAVRHPNTLDVGPTDSANGALPSPLSTLSTPFATACFVVGEFVFVSTNASLAGIPDTNILWLNPPLNDFGGPTPAANRFSAYPMLITMNDVGGLVLLDRPGSGQLGGVGTNFIANLILGNSWSYVTGGPEFIDQPANAFGSDVSLSAVAVAAGQTVTYQWQHVTAGTTNNLTNGLVNPGGAATVTIVTNANISTLALSGISTSDAAGYYQVVATASGTKFTLSSSAATVSVSLPPPPIIQFVYPPLINEGAGDHVACQVSATGTGNIFYQWYHANNILAGQTSPTLVLTNIQVASSGQYEVTVVDSSGMYVTSSITLNVSATPLPLFPSNLVVLRVGDGVQTLSGAAGNTIYLDQYTTTGVYVSSLMVPDENVGSPYGAGSSASVSGSPALLLPGAGNDYANSGLLTLSANQQFLTFAAYCANYPFGGADVTEGGASYSRGLAGVDAYGQYSLVYTNHGLYSGGNHSIRSGVTLDDTNFWTSGQAGSAGGVKYVNTQNTIYNDGIGIPSIATASAAGTYAVQVFETNLIYSDAAGSDGSGLYICSGTPEPAASGFSTATLLLNEGGQPNDFAISPDGRTIYIADSRTFTNATLQGGGVQRWDTNSDGGGYSFSYTLPVYEVSGAQGLTVYFPTNIAQWGGNVLGAMLFATSPSNVLSGIVDNGSTSTATVLVDTSSFNEQLHGVRFAPSVVIQTTPIITWTNPAPITYGTALSSNQLDASANLPGSFAYSAPIGSVLNVGTNTLSVVFTPLDTFHYTSATDTVSLVVTEPARPFIQTAKQSGSSFTFTWSATINQAYQIQCTGSLSPPEWTNSGEQLAQLMPP